jgi:geranylgeranyl reductase family protein
MHDVIVIGAGPGGSTTAHFLAQDGLDVLLLDKSDFPRDKTCGDGLSPRALAVLDEMGVLQSVNQAGFRMDEISVYAPKGTSVTTRVPERDDLPGYMLALPRLLLDDLIRERAIASGARFQGAVHVRGIEQLGNGVEVRGRSKSEAFVARARVAVIAIGASMGLLQTLGILKRRPEMTLAARAYFEDLQNIDGRFEFHFDGVPLPGYGWFFPLSDTSANVGAGIRLGRNASGRKPMRAKQVLGQFLQLPLMKKRLATARQAGPVKGFPLRTDFATAPTYDRRILLVGEAAGLVNPLTGEGVDYALESGKIAARHIIELLNKGEFSTSSFRQYDQALRARFQRLFVFSTRLRKWYMNKPAMNQLVHAVNRRDELRVLFTDIVLGNVDAARGVTLKTMMKMLFTW